jgi:hypothetical protein
VYLPQEAYLEEHESIYCWYKKIGIPITDLGGLYGGEVVSQPYFTPKKHVYSTFDIFLLETE